MLAFLKIRICDKIGRDSMRLNFRNGVKFTLGRRKPHFAKTEAEYSAKQAKLFKFTLKYPEVRFLDR